MKNSIGNFDVPAILEDDLFDTILQPVIDRHSHNKEMTNSMSDYALERYVDFVKNDCSYTKAMLETQQEIHRLIFE